eukprot:1113581-Prymnesium_polylepis.1
MPLSKSALGLLVGGNVGGGGDGGLDGGAGGGVGGNGDDDMSSVTSAHIHVPPQSTRHSFVPAGGSADVDDRRAKYWHTPPVFSRLSDLDASEIPSSRIQPGLQPPEPHGQPSLPLQAESW